MDTDALAELRETLGCCTSCARRFGGVRDPLAYLQTGEHAAASDEPAVCTVCLGVLQQCVRPQSVAAIAEAVRASGYELRTFSVSIALPAQLLFRERGAWLHLRRARAAKAAEAGAGVLASGQAQSGTDFHRIVDLKEAMRWALNDALSSALGAPIETTAPLIVRLDLSHGASEGEHHSIMHAMLPRESAYAAKKRTATGQVAAHDSIRAVQHVLTSERCDNLLRETAPLCPPSAHRDPCVVTVAIERENVALTGRYRKLSRTLPQSPWIVDGDVRKVEGSVAECIWEHAIPLFHASEGKFHSAGREDVDVRMLGDGRPFMVELVGPKAPFHTDEELRRLQDRINQCGLIEIEALCESDAAVAGDLMKQGEEAHRKDYRCIVSLSRPATAADVELINGTSELVVQQLTPMRVLHRRTLMVRERTIHKLHATRLSARFLQLDLTTQAGTYVKEFCHGDFGRTHPSVGSLLGCEVDILQLDVMGLQEMH
jgi:tRNA pseudouridine synthase 10